MNFRKWLLVFAVVALVILACLLLFGMLPSKRGYVPSAPPTAAPPIITLTPPPSVTLARPTWTPTATYTSVPTLTVTPSSTAPVPSATPTMETNTVGTPPAMPTTGGMPVTDPTQLALFAGVLWSLVLSYVPGIRERYDCLDGNRKRAILGAGIIIIGACIALLSCADFTDWIICDRPGLWGLAQNIILALIASQATYQFAPQMVRCSDAELARAVPPPSVPEPLEGAENKAK